MISGGEFFLRRPVTLFHGLFFSPVNSSFQTLGAEPSKKEQVMKTNPLFLITTALLCGGASLLADDICGGADDDQIFDAPSICGGADDDQICGGMDDDQFLPNVLQGLLGGPLSVVVSPGQPPVLRGIESDPFGVVTGPGQPPVLQGLVTDPLGLVPPFSPAPPPPATNVNDVMAAWNQLVAPAPVGICGGNGNDSFKPVPMTDAMILNILGSGSIFGGDGTDAIFGGGGTDDVIGPGDGTDI